MAQSKNGANNEIDSAEALGQGWEEISTVPMYRDAYTVIYHGWSPHELLYDLSDASAIFATSEDDIINPALVDTVATNTTARLQPSLIGTADFITLHKLVNVNENDGRPDPSDGDRRNVLSRKYVSRVSCIMTNKRTSVVDHGLFSRLGHAFSIFSSSANTATANSSSTGAAGSGGTAAAFAGSTATRDGAYNGDGVGNGSSAAGGGGPSSSVASSHTPHLSPSADLNDPIFAVTTEVGFRKFVVRRSRNHVVALVHLLNESFPYLLMPPTLGAQAVMDHDVETILSFYIANRGHELSSFMPILFFMFEPNVRNVDQYFNDALAQMRTRYVQEEMIFDVRQKQKVKKSFFGSIFGSSSANAPVELPVGATLQELMKTYPTFFPPDYLHHTEQLSELTQSVMALNDACVDLSVSLERENDALADLFELIRDVGSEGTDIAPAFLDQAPPPLASGEEPPDSVRARMRFVAQVTEEMSSQREHVVQPLLKMITVSSKLALMHAQGLRQLTQRPRVLCESLLTNDAAVAVKRRTADERTLNNMLTVIVRKKNQLQLMAEMFSSERAVGVRLVAEGLQTLCVYTGSITNHLGDGVPEEKVLEAKLPKEEWPTLLPKRGALKTRPRARPTMQSEDIRRAKRLQLTSDLEGRGKRKATVDDWEFNDNPFDDRTSFTEVFRPTMNAVEDNYIPRRQHAATLPDISHCEDNTEEVIGTATATAEDARVAEQPPSEPPPPGAPRADACKNDNEQQELAEHEEQRHGDVEEEPAAGNSHQSPQGHPANADGSVGTEVGKEDVKPGEPLASASADTMPSQIQEEQRKEQQEEGRGQEQEQTLSSAQPQHQETQQQEGQLAQQHQDQRQLQEEQVQLQQQRQELEQTQQNPPLEEQAQVAMHPDENPHQEQKEAQQQEQQQQEQKEAQQQEQKEQEQKEAQQQEQQQQEQKEAQQQEQQQQEQHEAQQQEQQQQEQDESQHTKDRSDSRKSVIEGATSLDNTMTTEEETPPPGSTSTTTMPSATTMAAGTTTAASATSSASASSSSSSTAPGDSAPTNDTGTISQDKQPEPTVSTEKEERC